MLIPFPCRNPSCPAWCRVREPHDIHLGQVHASLEHDEDGDVVAAIGARVHGIVAIPMVEFISWERDENGGVESVRRYLTAAEAIELGNHLLRCASELNGRPA